MSNLKKRFLLIGGAFLSASVAFVVLLADSTQLKNRLVNANDSVNWRHYLALANTYESRGSKEYWTDCNGSDPVFVAPEGVAITESGVPTSEFLSSLSLNDERLLPAFNEYTDVTPNTITLNNGNDAIGYVNVAPSTSSDLTYGPIYGYDFNFLAGGQEGRNDFFLKLNADTILTFAGEGIFFYVYLPAGATNGRCYYQDDVSWSGPNIDLADGAWNRVEINAEAIAKGNNGYLHFRADSMVFSDFKISHIFMASGSRVILDKKWNPALDYKSWKDGGETFYSYRLNHFAFDEENGFLSKTTNAWSPSAGIIFNAALDLSKYSSIVYTYKNSDAINSGTHLAIGNTKDKWGDYDYVQSRYFSLISDGQWHKLTVNLSEFAGKQTTCIWNVGPDHCHELDLTKICGFTFINASASLVFSKIIAIL